MLRYRMKRSKLLTLMAWGSDHVPGALHLVRLEAFRLPAGWALVGGGACVGVGETAAAGSEGGRGGGA